MNTHSILLAIRYTEQGMHAVRLPEAAMEFTPYRSLIQELVLAAKI